MLTLNDVLGWVLRVKFWILNVRFWLLSGVLAWLGRLSMLLTFGGFFKMIRQT